MDRSGIGDLDQLAHAVAGRGVEVVTTTGTALGAALTWGFRAVARPAGIRGLAVEAGCLTALAALYPLGVLAEQVDPDRHNAHYRTDDLSPVQRGLMVANVVAAGTPILLMHGIAHNRSAFTVLSRALRRRGFGSVHAVNYSVLTAVNSDVRRSAAQFGRHVERICEETGAEQVHVVGHSLGGIVARYYVQRLGGHTRVHTLVTLGSPHAGTMLAHLLPTPIARQLRPGSDVINELAEPAPECGTRFVSLWSELDQLVVPQRSARLEHPDLDVTSLRLNAVGHLSLPMDPRAVHAIASRLAHLDGPDRIKRTGDARSDRRADHPRSGRRVGSTPVTARGRSEPAS